jgi:nitrogen regulatory protein PII
MKMVFVVYSYAADYDVVNAFKEAGIRGYTKLEKASGEGVETEPKLHTHIWPGENCVMFLALEDTEVETAVSLIRKLRQEHPRAGVKGFILPLTEII